tara:strand:+ start:8632 stop:8838 length:207 start_codon:yes stop_codon:yes gene_type:complete
MSCNKQYKDYKTYLKSKKLIQIIEDTIDDPKAIEIPVKNVQGYSEYINSFCSKVFLHKHCIKLAVTNK